MKKAIVLILLAYGSIAYPQTSEVKLYDFLLKDQELTWQHVYNSDLNKAELIENIMNNVSSSTNTKNLNRSENKIRFDVLGDKIDYRKFGGKWGNTADFVRYPQSYSVEIHVKDNQYHVTVKNIEAILSNSMSMRIAEFSSGWHKDNLINSVSRKGKTDFRQSKSVSTGMNYIQKHYYSKFENLQFKKDAGIE